MASLIIDHRTKKPPAEEHAGGDPQLPLHRVTSERVTMSPVSVNGVAISRKAIAAEVQNFPAANPGEGWRAAAQALVLRELLLQEARRLGIPIEQRADERARLETEEEALIRALLDREIRIPQADEGMLRRFYDNNRHRFMSAPLYEAAHILVAARRDDAAGFAAACQKAAVLTSILAEHPDRFADLAREHSDCPSRTLGGNLGQIGPGETTPEFEAALVDLHNGAISKPVTTPYGIHIIHLLQRFDGQLLPFEAVRERIGVYLDEHVRRVATRQYLALLIGRADIRGIALDGANSPLVQ